MHKPVTFKVQQNGERRSYKQKLAKKKIFKIVMDLIMKKISDDYERILQFSRRNPNFPPSAARCDCQSKSFALKNEANRIVVRFCSTKQNVDNFSSSA